MPALHFFSEKQKGESFGEKLANAIEQGFSSGYQRLIVCGTDTPHLHSEQLLAVTSKLDTHNLVLGPSADGGVYLIGLQQDSFDRESFLQIPWLTAVVFSSLQSWAVQNQLTLSLLHEAADVDDAQDIRQWAAGSWFAPFIIQLLLAFKQLKYYSFFTAFYYSPLFSVSSVRGPPSQSF